mmetsp:Transcript_21036/g.37265  ORF Transcript_21036/g.37265 Transcript_21036/m.37265 type:complete len:315 (-) Transcript_21036:389-1333(-)
MSGFGDYGGGGGYGGGGDEGGGGFGGFGDGGNNGGFGGGGFMQGGSTQSPIASGAQRVDSLTPITIKQTTMLEDSPAGDFMLDGRPIRRVSMLCRILEVTKKEVNVRFDLTDGTGVMAGSWYLDAETDDPSERFDAGMYVKVFGKLRTFNNKVTLNIETLKLVHDHNQITHHFLNVVFTHLQVTKGPVNKALAAGGNPAEESSGIAPSFNNTDSYPSAHQSNAPMNMSTGQTIQSNAAGGGGDLTQILLRIFNRPEVEELDAGYSVQMAFAEVQKQGHKTTENEVKNVIHALSNDGHLYSTVDDDHFKSTGEVA